MDKAVKSAIIWALTWCLFIGMTFFPYQADAYSGPEIEAQGAILLEINSGKVLYAKNEHKRLYPASTTKILTALICLENCSLGELVTVGEEINKLPTDGSSAKLELGEKLTVMDLLNGLMLPSGNDAANVLAVHVARKVSGDPTMEIDRALQFFAALMNKRSAEIDALNSHFANPHGLHEENHYTTPADLAKIALAAMENPLFRQIVRTQEYKVGSRDNLNQLDQVNSKVWENTNKLLDRDSTYYMEQATGIKTGFTTPAGYCLVSSAAGNGLELIGVVLNTTATGRWTDSTKLLNFGLEEFKNVWLLRAGTEVTKVAIANPHKKDPGELEVLAIEDFADLFHHSQISAIERHFIWDEELLAQGTGNMLRAPIKEGQELGRIFLTLDGLVLTESTVVAARDVKSDSLLENIFDGNFPLPWLFGGFLGIMFISIARVRKTHRKRTIRF